MERGKDSGANESSGIIRKVFRKKSLRLGLPGELQSQNDEEGYVLISHGDLSPSMAYLHGSTPIIKKSKPRHSSTSASWLIRNTQMSFWEIAQKSHPRSKDQEKVLPVENV